MNAPFKAVKIACLSTRQAENIYWVGAIDWNLRDFHGYSTDMGTTYNAYLITGKNPTLIDTVKAPFYNEMMARISSVMSPKNIKTIISNHAEMDHSGSLPMLLKDITPQKLIASQMGEKALKTHFDLAMEITTVKDGEVVDMGFDKIKFIEAKMLHWPDSMVSYLENEKILFSNDIFGMHLAHSKRFDDETPDWYYQAAKYYANIVMPYSSVVLGFAKKITAAKIEPKIIAPDHGPVWRKDVSKIINLYVKWAQRKPINKAVIAYDTMWQSTEKLGFAIAEGLIENGTTVKVMSLKAHHRSDIVTELADAGAFLAGAPTMNAQIYPSMADLLTYIKGLKPQGLIGNVFGSYGWAPNAITNMETEFKQMQIKPVGTPVKCQYVPTNEDLQSAYNLGAETSKHLKETV
jgi:flavorubredoxin